MFNSWQFQFSSSDFPPETEGWGGEGLVIDSGIFEVCTGNTFFQNYEAFLNRLLRSTRACTEYEDFAATMWFYL
jgi:hypothetical protein